MSKRTNIILTSAMMGIATAACAFCVAQSANAAEMSAASSGANNNFRRVGFARGKNE